MDPKPGLIVLFVVYVIATLWLGGRALATTEPADRLRAARAFLVVVFLGVPLSVALILAL
ncbi:MAG: hypothetical protein EXR64_03900 [Dehalococcoidia bacterium]|nr:hypothetical protein [Dehalococcoidia bacterium]